MTVQFRIDSHVHIMPPMRLAGLARWILKAFPDHPVKESVTPDDILDELCDQGITHFFNFIYPLKVDETDFLNSFNIDFCSRTPGAVPFASLHQETPDKVAVAENVFRENRVAGFKFHPFVQRFDPWDRRMDAFYSFMQEAGRPIFFHTGFEVFYGMKMPIEKLEKLVESYPRLPMVFVHMAFPKIARVFRLLEIYPELYLDATNVLAFLRPEFAPMIEQMPGREEIFEQLFSGMEKHSDRIMYGSDHPVGMGGLQEIYRDMDELRISDAAKENIQHHTPMRFVNRFMPGFDWNHHLRS